MLQLGKIFSSKVYTNEILFICENEINMTLSFPEESVLRIRMNHGHQEKPSIMVELGYIKEFLAETMFDFIENSTEYEISTGRLLINVKKENGSIRISDKNNSCFLETVPTFNEQDGDGSLINFKMKENDHFYGLGFQRNSFDARGQKLRFTREFRWKEATVPFFISTAGYGFFSSNTYDQTFDFTGNESFSITGKKGQVDYFIIYGPDFKDILNIYTALTGRPIMVPKWAFGVCYIARCFTTDKQLMEIAQRFRLEGIPCDMLGLEPGWEEVWYGMQWIWNKECFSDPAKTINDLENLGFKFELWESGEAPIEGILDPEVRKKWFAKRIEGSINKGVAFYKQDDPYPRSITTTEMVSRPIANIKVMDEELKSISNTLYTSTAFDEFRRLTGKRTILMLNAYNASISSQMYACAWAADFKLGHGALNASLSGHAMVSQDMNNQSPGGLHFGFLTPFSIIDSWAYYREPWLYSEAILDMTRLYSRLKSSLFPYLYSTFWQSHTKGIPMLRPMILAFQQDKKTTGMDKQFMLGDSLLVGTAFEDSIKFSDVTLNTGTDINNSSVYLPEGQWIDYWTGKFIDSTGEWIISTWPEHVGGPLYAKAGAIIPMTSAGDSISLNKQELLILDIYPHKKSSTIIYEDDGESFNYEKMQYSLTNVTCEETEHDVRICLGKAIGDYEGKLEQKAYLLKIHICNIPEKVEMANLCISCKELDNLLYTFDAGWFFDSSAQILYIKPQNTWRLKYKVNDIQSFYNAKIEWIEQTNILSEFELSVTKGQFQILYGASPNKLELSTQYSVLLADGESKTLIQTTIKDKSGLLANVDDAEVVFKLAGPGKFENNQNNMKIKINNGIAQLFLYSDDYEGTVEVSATCGSLNDHLFIQVVQGNFDIVFNPAERIRLFFEDDWLPYYMFPFAQIRYEGKIVASAKSKVLLKITGNEERNFARTHSCLAVAGSASFFGITLGKPTEPPDVIFHFSAKGVNPISVRYQLQSNVQKKLR